MNDTKDQGDTPSPMEKGMGMAKKMMAQMGKGGPSPMAMMEKMMGQMAEGGQAPPPVMQMCMGMCSEMLTAIKRSTDMAALATPELQQLFAEWLATLEDEALRHLKEAGETNTSGLAKTLNISEESTAHLIARMISNGKVDAQLRPSKAGK